MTVAVISDNTGATYSGLFAVEARESNPSDQYYGGGNIGRGVEVQTYASGDRAHGFLFPTGLSNLVGLGATVTDVVLEVYATEIGATFDIVARGLIVAATYNQLTWDDRLTGTAWTGGGATSTSDRNATVLATASLTSSGTGYQAFSNSGLIAWAQAIVDGGTNYGLTIAPANDTAYNGDYMFFSDNTQTDGQRPKLTVTYTTGTSVALTGASITASQGTLSGQFTKALTTNASTIAQGTMAALLASFVTGNLETSAQGTLTASATKSLTGSSETESQGSFSLSHSVAINTILETLSQGTVTPNTVISIDVALTGQSVSIAQGSLLKDVTGSITGIYESQQQGIVSPSGTVNIQLTGSQYSYLQGDLLAQSIKSIVGSANTLSSGNLTANNSLQVSGNSESSAQGQLALTIARSLSGASNSYAQGVLTANTDSSISVALTGQQIAISQGILASGIVAGLVGSQISALQGLLTLAPSTHSQYPLAGVTQVRPILIGQLYPLTGIKQNRPLE